LNDSPLLTGNIGMKSNGECTTPCFVTILNNVSLFEGTVF